MHESPRNNFFTSRILHPTFASSNYRYIPWPGSYIKYYWFLNPWNVKMCSFTNNELFNSGESIKYYGAMPTINCTKNNCHL